MRRVSTPLRLKVQGECAERAGEGVPASVVYENKAYGSLTCTVQEILLVASVGHPDTGA